MIYGRRRRHRPSRRRGRRRRRFRKAYLASFKSGLKGVYCFFELPLTDP